MPRFHLVALCVGVLCASALGEDGRLWAATSRGLAVFRDGRFVVNAWQQRVQALAGGDREKVACGRALARGLRAIHGLSEPVQPEAVLRYDVPTAGRIRVPIYDVLGREVVVLIDGEHPARIHEAVLDGRNLASDGRA